jgi:DNA-binding transcriptional LysR family regulator
MSPRPINFRTLDLNLLRVFDVVMVERHVTRAAQRLAMSQPAVSNALRRLRDAMQEDLFIPGPGGVTPTTHAEALWPAIRTALRQLEDALAPQGFDARTDTRSFTLAMEDATAARFMPELAELLQRERAGVAMRVVGLTTRDPRPLLEQGEIDVALGFFPEVALDLAGEGETASCRLQPLFSTVYQCVMRRGHPLATLPQLSLDAYCAADHLRVSFEGRPIGFVDEALARLGRSRRVLLTVNQFGTATAVAHRSDLLTVLPRSFLLSTGFGAGLLTRPLPFELPAIEVGLLWHRRHEADTAQRWLRDVLARVADAIADETPATP